ncbi:uridine kinase family protein [Kineosporia babensis]|uniref:AAA+ ATPase domain-containing protein n=1 Tax=Kineosporia babensis TaxID=499548 RepID=A0A9X1NKX4_9ACTN|nr:hypothetical protein [Kineosporia babensis]MCD5315674.1 hypothetical protein [Kineosporia babensis]
MTAAAPQLADAIRVKLTSEGVLGERPFVVAIDGRSGAGKSTLAGAVAGLLGECLVIDGDDFYAGGSLEEWAGRSPAAKVAEVMDWRRQRELLTTLRAGKNGTWFGYDWEAFDGRLSTTATVAEPARVIVLEGAYSARPELADQLDLRVLAEADLPTRRRRLRERDGEQWHDAWFDLWSQAEDFYFGRIVPAAGFDLRLAT